MKVDNTIIPNIRARLAVLHDLFLMISPFEFNCLQLGELLDESYNCVESTIQILEDFLKSHPRNTINYAS